MAHLLHSFLILILIASLFPVCVPAGTADPDSGTAELPSGSSPQETPGPAVPSRSERQSKPLILIAPFTFDKSPSADLIASRAAWILGKKLQAGRYRFERLPANPDDSDVRTDEERILDYARLKTVDYLIAGQVCCVSIDRSAEWKGRRFLGMAEIPVVVEVMVRIQECGSDETIWQKTTRITNHVPRLMVFGMSRQPYPGTPQTVDALIHQGIYLLSNDVIDAIGMNAGRGSQ